MSEVNVKALHRGKRSKPEAAIATIAITELSTINPGSIVYVIAFVTTQSKIEIGNSTRSTTNGEHCSTFDR